MSPVFAMTPARRTQRGVSAILMIAVIVVLGGVTTYAVGLVTSVHSSHARAISFARADAAAHAGLDWGRYRVAIAGVPQCASAQSLNNLPGSLRPYTVTVRCTAFGPYTEGAATLGSYQLSATACNRPQAGRCPNANADADYVERTVTTLVQR